MVQWVPETCRECKKKSCEGCMYEYMIMEDGAEDYPDPETF